MAKSLDEEGRLRVVDGACRESGASSQPCCVDVVGLTPLLLLLLLVEPSLEPRKQLESALPTVGARLVHMAVKPAKPRRSRAKAAFRSVKPLGAAAAVLG